MNEKTKIRKILFIVNKKSGSDSNSNIGSLIEKTMTANGIGYEFYFLKGENDKSFIKRKLEDFKPETIVAAGGDGTINLVASVISGLPLKLGILPTGSANGLAFELGISEKPEDALRLIVQGTAKPMDVVRINEDHISLHLCDLGINARIVKEFEKEGKRGFAGYIKHFLKELIKPQKTFRCLVFMDGKTFKHKALMTIVANSGSYRTGAKINATGKKDDGLFELVIIKPYKRWVWKSFTGAFSGTLHQQPHIETYSCTSAIIDIFPKQELQIDGESMGLCGEVRAKIEKHALRVIGGM